MEAASLGILWGLSLSRRMQLMNCVRGLPGKHSTALAQLQLTSLEVLLFVPVASSAGFCKIFLLFQFSFGMRRQIAVFYLIYS